ncbi:MAG TPA: glycosyltransferase [Chitinophagaceae bacterium]|jgi:glycosyltransferase involved in cell wall biosynthesis|nr:glycosyltransferase [Chitinophagaceae bacterium]
MKLTGNILVLTQWSFNDALVQTYTLPYVEILRETIPEVRKIFVVTSEQEKKALTQREINDINDQWKSRNMELIAQPYKRFGWKKLVTSVGQMLKLYRTLKKNKVDVIHSFCTPAGSIGYLLSIVSGATLVIDSYEPHATAMVETGAWKKDSVSFKLLFGLEKKLSEKASYIIATTKGMKQYAVENYGVELKNFFVKPACISFEDFYPRPKDVALLEKFGLNDKIVCVYAGKLGGTYLRDEVFDFVRSCYEYWGDSFRFLMLSEESDEIIQSQLKRTGIPANIIIKQYVVHKEIPRYLSLGDFGINPQVPVPSKRYGSPIKNGEYLAMGLPIVISPGISDDSDIIAENGIGVVTNLQQIENMSAAVCDIDTLLKNNSRENLQEKIFGIAKQYRSFDIARRIYPLIYEN